MKKCIIALITLCSIAFISCQKENTVYNENAPSVAPSTFTVSMPTTKTVLDGLHVFWAEGDKIRVYGHNTETDTYTDNATYTISDGAGQDTAVFTKDNDSEMTGTYDEYYAVYPGDLTISGLPETMVFPRLNVSPNHLRNQSPASGQYDPSLAIMTATYSNNKLVFRHGVAFVKITVPDDNVTKIDISFTANCLADTPTYTTSTGDLKTVSNSSKNITSAEGSYLKGQSYYFAAIPRSGYNPTTTVITFTGGQTYTTTHFTKPLVIGEVYDLGTPSKSTKPIINSEDIEIGYDVVSGSINYVIDNPVADGVISAEIQSSIPESWLTLSAVSSSSIPFTCTENNLDENRIASILLVYSYEDGAKTVSKEISVTQLHSSNSALTAINTEKEWNVTNNFKPLAQSMGTSALNDTFIDDNLKYVCDGKIQFNQSYLRFGGTGSSTDNCVQFMISGPGTLTVVAKSAKSGDETRSVGAAHNSTPLTTQTINSTNNDPYSWTINTAQEGDIISVYSGNSGINVYSISWVPAS